MHCIQNYSIGTSSPFNKVIAGFTFVLAITVIALSIIGITATSVGPFNAFVQLGTTTNGILLGTSIFVFILDLVWIAALCKKPLVPPTEEINDKDPLSQPPEEINDTDPLSQPPEEINDTDPLSQPPEEINDKDLLNRLLPEEMIFKVFNFLSITELTRCTEVNRKWNRLVSDKKLWNAMDLRKISPPLLKVFDESDWNTYVDLSSFGLTTQDVSPIDKRTAIPALVRLLPSLRIEGDAGVTLLTIPKGLTFNKLVKLAGSPKMGNAHRFENIWDRISNEIGDIPVDKTYRIVITNNVFKNSRNLSFDNQKALVTKFGCEVPKVLEAFALVVVTFMRSGERLYSNSYPSTYTSCSDKLRGYRDQLVVGGFSPNGVNFSYFNYAGSFQGLGIGGVLRKFQAIDN